MSLSPTSWRRARLGLSIDVVAEGSESLARMTLFRSLGTDAIRNADQACSWRRARAGEQILDYQSGGTDLFLVLRGHVRVTVITEAGEVILRDIRDDEFFGEIAAIDGLPRSSAIVAVIDTTLARMTAPVFRKLVHAHPDVCDQLLLLLASQVRMLANRVNEHSTLSVAQRIYAELLRLARPAKGGKSEAVISPPPTHSELAARVGTRREAVTRELNGLERDGLLERRRGAIVVLDPARLRRMIEPPA